MPNRFAKYKPSQIEERSDNTRVVRQPVVKPIKRKLKDGETEINLPGQKPVIVRSKNAVVKADNRSAAKQQLDWQRDDAIRQKYQEQKNNEEFDKLFSAGVKVFSPSTYAGAAARSLTDDGSFADNVMGGAGFGDNTANVVFDAASPLFWKLGANGIKAGTEFLQNTMPGIFDPHTIFRRSLGHYGNTVIIKNPATYDSQIRLNAIEESKGSIPTTVWEKGIKDYKSIINSENYADRIRRASLSDDHLNYMKEFTDWSLENPPHRVVDVIENNPDINGLSRVDPNDPLYGITLKKGLSPKELESTLIHEIAHFATRNRKTDSTSMIGDIMRANEAIAENIPWEQKLWEYPENTPVKDIMNDLDLYNYITDPQEKRSFGIEIRKYAKDSKMSTNDFIDKFIESDEAPLALKYMRYIMTPDNLKKYVRNFMGIASPAVVIPTLFKKNNDNEETKQ